MRLFYNLSMCVGRKLKRRQNPLHASSIAIFDFAMRDKKHQLELATPLIRQYRTQGGSDVGLIPESRSDPNSRCSCVHAWDPHLALSESVPIQGNYKHLLPIIQVRSLVMCMCILNQSYPPKITYTCSPECGSLSACRRAWSRQINSIADCGIWVSR